MGGYELYAVFEVASWREMRHPPPLDSESESDTASSSGSELVPESTENEGERESERHVSILPNDVVDPSPQTQQNISDRSRVSQELQIPPKVSIKSNMKQQVIETGLDNGRKTTDEAVGASSHGLEEVQPEERGAED